MRRFVNCPKPEAVIVDLDPSCPRPFGVDSPCYFSETHLKTLKMQLSKPLLAVAIFPFIQVVVCSQALDKTVCLEEIKTLVSEGKISIDDRNVFFVPPGNLNDSTSNPTITVQACEKYCGSGPEVKQDCAGRVKEVRFQPPTRLAR
jgi:hypothetical protein